MKKYFLLLTATLALLAVSCNREKEIDTPNPGKATHAVSDNTPMAVVFTSKFPAVKSPDIATKGAGAIDDWGGGTKKPLYIYGFPTYRVDKGVKSYEWIDYTQATALIYNVAADQPEPDGDSEGVRLDGSQRSKINVYNAAAIGNGTVDAPQGLDAHEPFFYKENPETSQPIAYSFFGYYVDDAIADPNPVVTPAGSAPTYNVDGSVAAEPAAFGTIKLDGLSLDGTQDIMIAATDKEVDALARSRYLDQEHYGTTELTDDDLGEYVAPELIYSSHAARRGINPDLIFEHQLSRVTFYVKKGGTVPSSDLVIAGIDLFDYVEGDLTITAGKSGTENTGLEPKNGGAAIDWDFEDAWKEDLKINPADANLLKYIKTVRTSKDINVTLTDETEEFHPTKEYKPFGQSVLVFSGRQKLDMVLKIIQANATAPGYRPYKTHLEIENAPDKNDMPVKFEPGKNYNVYLTVYGLEEVRISVTLTEWENARIDLDPDMDDDDNREPAQILFGTDRQTDPHGIISKVSIPEGPGGTPAAKPDALYEDFTADAIVLASVYPNPSQMPKGELTIRDCDTFDLLDTEMFVQKDELAAHTDIAGTDWAADAADHYEPVLAFVRSNSTGDFHFSLSSGTVTSTVNAEGITVYENEHLILTDTGIIMPKEAIDYGTEDHVEDEILVRQNSTNDYLAAIPRTITLTIRKDDRVPVRINWVDKTGAAEKEPAIKIIAEGGQSGTVNMDATFTIDYDKDRNWDNDVTYQLTWKLVNDDPADDTKGWMPTGYKVVPDATLTALSGPDEILNKEALTTDDANAYVRFGLKFSIVKLLAGKDGSRLDHYELDKTTGVARVDAQTGVITALKTGDTKVLVELNNLPNDDTYTPTWKVIDISVVNAAAVISGVPDEITLKYGELYTFKPVVQSGAGTITYATGTPANVGLYKDNDKSGVIIAKHVGTSTITITVADSHFYTTAEKTCEVTVEKADPEVTVKTITVDALNDVDVLGGDYITLVESKYAGEGIVVTTGAKTIEYCGTPAAPNQIFDANVDKTDAAADGYVKGVAAGRATLYLDIAADDNYNAVDNLPITVVVNAIANTFDLAEAANVAVDANGDGITNDAVYTTAEGDVVITGVTKAGAPEPNFAAKFYINNATQKIEVNGVTIPGDYVLTVRAAGDKAHLSSIKEITLTVAYDDPAVDPNTANAFDLIAATSLWLDDAGNGTTEEIYTDADGPVSIISVTKGGADVASWNTKFALAVVGGKNVINLTGITEAGTYVLTLHALGDADHVEATKTISITINLKGENNFDLVGSAAVTVSAAGDGITADAVYTKAEGAVTITGVTKGGADVAGFATKFQLNPAKKLLLTGVTEAGDYEITFNAAGDATHKAVDKVITVTVTVAP